jgi:hypothetical protein
MRKMFLFVFSFATFALFTAAALTSGTPAAELTPKCADEGVETIAECPDTRCGDFGDAKSISVASLTPSLTRTAGFRHNSFGNLVVVLVAIC